VINNGVFADTTAPQLVPEMSLYIQDQPVNLPPYLFLVIAGLERAFTIFVHTENEEQL